MARCIDDPFHGLSLQDIENDARRFHGEAPGLKSILDVEVLIKGAKLAKDSNAIDTIPIAEVERRVLEEKKQSNLRGLREVIQQFGEGMRVTIMVTACAAVALGWQQSAINTSTRTWPDKFGLAPDSWTVAAINAIPSLSGSIIGTWVSNPLQGFSLSRDDSIPDNARYEANGLEPQESGTKASVAPIFAAEAALEKPRGRILMLWQLFDAFGIMLGFVVALIVPASWEAQLGLAMIPSLAQILVVMLCPELPRLLIRNERYGEAYRSLRRLRRLELQAARDLYFIHFQLRQEVWIRFQAHVVPFTLPRNRRACLVAFLVMTSQQLYGINVLSYYSSTAFGNAASTNKINLLSFGFGASNFVFTLAAFVLIDFQGAQIYPFDVLFLYDNHPAWSKLLLQH
ncbi:hypothetical protein BDW67DRAFT_181911 [Aspergillus spinulosporus]